MNIEVLRTLHKTANRIFNSQADWETKYDLIFAPDLSGAVFKQIRLEYCDPDTTYQEDVTAFITAFNEKMAQLEKAFA